MSCYYVTWTGQALGATHFLPFIITGVLKVMAFIYHEPLFFFLGMWWLLAQGVLWLAQQYFQVVRPDPFCAVYHSYAYPSSETYYAVALVTLVVVWTIYYRVKQSVTTWLVLYLILIVPAALLWYTQMNRWWEILWTALFSVVSTVFFTLLLIQGIGPNIDYLEASPLFGGWYSWHSTFFRRDGSRQDGIRNALGTLDHLHLHRGTF